MPEHDTVPPEDYPKGIASRPGVFTPVFTALLVCALVLNVTALFLPFVEVKKVMGTENYSLIRSVILMWEGELYVIAVLVAAFSLCFPFIKLFWLARVYWYSMDDSRRRLEIQWVNRLGKWSLLDVFISCLLIVLTNDQWLVGARPRFGIYIFITAIFLAMVAGSWLSGTTFSREAAAAPTRGPGRRPWSTPVWLVASVLVLFACLGVPYIQISDFFLFDHAYNLANTITALWKNADPFLSIFVSIVILGLPLLRFLTLFLAWQKLVIPYIGRYWELISEELNTWSMLDVFGLALMIFLTEGDRIVKTEFKNGLYLIMIGIVLINVGGYYVHRDIARQRGYGQDHRLSARSNTP